MRKTLLLALPVALGLVATASFVSPALGGANEFAATIDGLQEVPPVVTNGSGNGCFTLNSDNTLSFNIEFSGLTGTETAAHIHGPAPPGANAGVQFGLPTGSPKVGSVGPLSAQQVSDLQAGLYYVNIHSTTNPGGEIRGQIIAGACGPVSVEETTWGRIKSLYD